MKKMPESRCGCQRNAVMSIVQMPTLGRSLRKGNREFEHNDLLDGMCKLLQDKSTSRKHSADHEAIVSRCAKVQGRA